MPQTSTSDLALISPKAHLNRVSGLSIDPKSTGAAVFSLDGYTVLSALSALVIAVVLGSAASAQSLTKKRRAAPSASLSSGCAFFSAPGTPAAFCETFDQPAGIGNRSGDLNGTLWGVSRLLGAVNSGQGQFYDVIPTIMQKCGQNVQAQPPNDVAICNGQLVESQSDQGGVTSISMYPKQPFDIAGRTGTIAFDVSDDSHGNHRVWPELWYTDQPVPTPFVHFSSLQSTPRNGFGIRFAGSCPPGDLACRFNLGCPNFLVNDRVVTVDSAVVVNNYVSNDSFTDSSPVPATISVQHLGCVKASSGPGDMNHFELRVSQNEIDVYGADAGSTTLRQIAAITNAPLTLTRGLVWLEDVHYNGNKDGPDQGTHTFTWDNVAFDGPVLPRDLAFDVLEALTPVGPNYPGVLNLGWPVGITDADALTLTVPGVSNIAQAAGAILTFNYSTTNPITISYRVNNGAWHDQAWPFGPCYTQNGAVSCGEKTIAVPVSLSEVQPGANTIQFKGSDFTAVANVDLVLLGAAGGGCTSNCPVATAATLISSKNPSTFGESVTLTATVTASGGVPTGNVTFSDSGAVVGTVPLGSAGTATLTTSSMSVGTHALAASYGGAAGFTSSSSAMLSQVVNAITPQPVTRFDWESGNLSGWQVAWGRGALSLANSTDQAFSGTHSLKMVLSTTETHSAVDYETNPQLSGFVPGATVTLHIFSQSAGGITVYAFAHNENWIPNFGAAFPLRAGWNAVTYTIPASFGIVHGIGVQINGSGAHGGTLYLDAVTTQ